MSFSNKIFQPSLLGHLAREESESASVSTINCPVRGGQGAFLFKAQSNDNQRTPFSCSKVRKKCGQMFSTSQQSSRGEPRPEVILGRRSQSGNPEPRWMDGRLRQTDTYSFRVTSWIRFIGGNLCRVSRLSLAPCL